MRSTVPFLVTLALCGLLPPTPLWAEASCPDLQPTVPPWARRAPVKSGSLPVSKGLARRVAFWEEVWGERGDDDVAIVDQRRPWVVHAWVDCSDVAEEACTARTRERLAAVRRGLEKTWRKNPGRLVQRLGSHALARSASWNLRLVRGRADALDRAYERGEAHLAELEGIFAHEGVPASLARLAVVESLFRPDSRSRAGAVGAYQFVRATAREHLSVEGAIDERTDPIRAGWAAARYLRRLGDRFDRWDVAVTAYNAGPTRVARMLRHQQVRGLAPLVASPSDPAFGFDAQNYYAQIVAVARVSRDWSLRPARRPPRHLRLARPVGLKHLARCVGRHPTRLAQANPALQGAILRGKQLVPRGYVLALPPRKGPKLAMAAEIDEG
ncbi:MAG: lytic transglycosylase domain-containing protein [Deltaproteobacteria bacterium]|nr:lytic transglycosylase domain-containing protein [Deltaproteobacteria bacterium]